MVLTSGPKYGETKRTMAVNQQVLINGVNHVLADRHSRDDMTVGQLWTVLLCNHMAEILQQNRYSIRKILGIFPSCTRDWVMEAEVNLSRAFCDPRPRLMSAVRV